MGQLSREQIEDLLYYLGASKIRSREGKDDIQFTCTVHGESNPSAGINIETGQFNCFSCHASGGIARLMMLSSPEEFKDYNSVQSFLMKRYKVKLSTIKMHSLLLNRYGEKVETTKDRETKKIVSKSFLAPYKSGKETYKYFFDRGFTKDTMIKFKIGRDLINKTVTVPVFYDSEDEVAGVIGRYIDPHRPKNMRYKIYEVNTGSLVFPQDKCEPINGVLIQVEGLLDALYMHQLGYTNTYATLTNNISKTQAKWVRSKRPKEIWDFTDNDEMGELSSKSLRKMLGKSFEIRSLKDFYPRGCKDPQDCSPKQIEKIMDSFKSTKKHLSIRRRT